MIARLVNLFPASTLASADALGLLLLRLVLGGAMIYAHGWGKLTNFGTIAEGFPDPLGVGSSMSLGLAVFAEVFCAAALVVGLLTRLATIPLIVTMAVAFFVVHADDPFARKELAFVYLGGYVALLFKGAGAWSIDGLVARTR